MQGFHRMKSRLVGQRLAACSMRMQEFVNAWPAGLCNVGWPYGIRKRSEMGSRIGLNVLLNGLERINTWLKLLPASMRN